MTKIMILVYLSKCGKQLKKFCTYLMLGIMRLLSLLPLKVHYFLCRILSLMAEYLFRYRKNVVKVNIDHSFPDRTGKEKAEIIHRFYRHFGDIIAEALWFGKFRDREKLRKKGFCTFENVDGHRKDFENAAGVMVLTSHAGNWEVMGGWFAYAPYGALGYTEESISVVYKSLKSSLWDMVMADNRCAPLHRTEFNGYVDSTRVLRHALEHRSQKRAYIFPTDQYPYRNATKHEIGEFLGQKTLAMTGGAALAGKLHLAVEYMGMECISRGRYRMTFRTICEDASTMSPEEIMSRYYEFLQKDIEAQPWNYLWTHKRWKNIYDYGK